MATYKVLCADNLSRCWHCLKLFAQGEPAAVLIMPDKSRRFVHAPCSATAVVAAGQTDWASAEANVPASLLQ